MSTAGLAVGAMCTASVFIATSPQAAVKDLKGDYVGVAVKDPKVRAG